MSNLAVWIRFESEEDAIKATGILFRAGESYAGNSHGWIFVSRDAIRMFEEQGVTFAPVVRTRQPAVKERIA